jgi:hypothetical protein
MVAVRVGATVSEGVSEDSVVSVSGLIAVVVSSPGIIPVEVGWVAGTQAARNVPIIKRVRITFKVGFGCVKRISSVLLLFTRPGGYCKQSYFTNQV